MDKAERIYQELLQGKTGIWYISDGYGSKVMIKVPSSILKAIIKGCKIELAFGLDDNIFHIGIKIYDDPINFITLTSAQKNIDEHFSIAKIMQLDKVQIQLYNELCACQCFGDIILTTKNKNDILCLLGNPKRLFTGLIDERIHHSADNFQFSLGLDIPNNHRTFTKIETLIIETKIENLQTMNNTFVEDTGIVSTKILDPDEGTLLEKEVFVVLRSLFGSSIHHSPQIAIKTPKQRELIDILAYSDYGVFLIESKALGIINSNDERNMDRKVKGLQKQIEKGIKQIVGTHKNISENEHIYTKSGEKIEFNRNLPPCGIVLVSELLPFGKWDHLLQKLLTVMSESGIMIHIMDMNELMQFVGHSKNDKDLFDYYLMERMQSFVENPSILRETKFIKGDNNE